MYYFACFFAIFIIYIVYRMNNQLNYISAARRDQLIEQMDETLQHRKSFLLDHYKDMKKNNDQLNTSILADYEDYYNNINMFIFLFNNNTN